MKNSIFVPIRVDLNTTFRRNAKKFSKIKRAFSFCEYLRFDPDIIREIRVVMASRLYKL